jgi:hypothetical protein
MIMSQTNNLSANFAVALKLREDVLPTAESIETLDFRWFSSNAEDSQLIKKELQSLSTQSKILRESIPFHFSLANRHLNYFFSECILSVKIMISLLIPFIEPGWGEQSLLLGRIFIDRYVILKIIPF